MVNIATILIFKNVDSINVSISWWYIGRASEVI